MGVTDFNRNRDGLTANLKKLTIFISPFYSNNPSVQSKYFKAGAADTFYFRYFYAQLTTMGDCEKTPPESVNPWKDKLRADFRH